MTDPFECSSQFYDSIYSHKDAVKESDYVLSLLQRYRISGTELLEFGSGTGRHARIIAEKGFRVHGIEKSSQMAEIAQSFDCEGFTCEVGDICTFQQNGKYDAVIALFHVVSYQGSNEELISVFNNARLSLKPGGLFLFDVWYSPAVYYQKPETRLKQVKTNDYEIIRFAEPDIDDKKNIVSVNYTAVATPVAQGVPVKYSEQHQMRHFSIPEIDLLCRLTGFEVLQAEEWLTGSMPSKDTWGVCFVVRRKEIA